MRHDLKHYHPNDLNVTIRKPLSILLSKYNVPDSSDGKKNNYKTY